MTGLWTHLQRDPAEYTALIGLLVVAAIANMTQPAEMKAWLQAWKNPARYRWWVLAWFQLIDQLGILYDWIYKTLQAFMAARNPHPPTPPEPPGTLLSIAPAGPPPPAPSPAPAPQPAASGPVLTVEAKPLTPKL